MDRNISVLGSTGSIGIQTLEVARNLGIHVVGLSANVNIDLLEQQAREFKPVAVAIKEEKQAGELAARLAGTGIEVYSGIEGLKTIATLEKADTVVTSIVGIAGLIPTLAAINKGKNIALANKETLVTAGHLVMAEAKKNHIKILPVDSEHAAIFQCLMGNKREQLSKVILTASGGPFRGKSIDTLEQVTLKQALNHPKWKMGSKISIDSATLMNKGLEVIEAKWLFDLEANQVDVIVHPQSIVHSMVEYIDGSVMAQLGYWDMKIPIQFALTYPDRLDNPFPRLNLLEYNTLTFEKPDYKAFPCLQLAYDAMRAGGSMPVALNAANEEAVNLFLEEKIGFMDIPRKIDRVMEKHILNNMPGLDDIIEIDKWARELVRRK